MISHGHIGSVLLATRESGGNVLVQPERSSYHIEDAPRNRCLTNLMRTPRILLLSPRAHKTLLEDRRACQIASGSAVEGTSCELCSSGRKE